MKCEHENYSKSAKDETICDSGSTTLVKHFKCDKCGCHLRECFTYDGVFDDEEFKEYRGE